MYNNNLIISECVPYSEQACRDSANSLGLTLGGGGYPFKSHFKIKGCYAYSSGKYAGLVFYGTGGTPDQMKTVLSGEKYRPTGYNCIVAGI